MPGFSWLENDAVTAHNKAKVIHILCHWLLIIFSVHSFLTNAYRRMQLLKMSSDQINDFHFVGHCMIFKSTNVLQTTCHIYKL